MKAAVVLAPGRMEIRDQPVPESAPDEVLIRVMASGICGTDIHIFRGEFEGSYPIVTGHEFSGVVEKAGAAAAQFRPGDRVAVEPNLACEQCDPCRNNRQNFCRNWQAVGVTRPGAMAQYVAVPEKAVFGIGEMPFERGAFMEPLSCALHGIERLDPDAAARITLLGAGPIGILLLQLVRLRGAVEVTVAEKNPARAALARSLGAGRSVSGLEDLAKDSYDAVIDATGAVAAMSRTVEFVRPGGKILLFGVPPAGSKLSLDAFSVFRKGLTIVSSFASRRNSLQAIDLLRSGRVSVDGLISHRLPLERLQRGIETIERGEEEVRKVMILPNG